MKADTLQIAREEQRAPWTEVEIDTRDFTVFRDKYPVTEGHLLVVPKEATQENIMKCFNFAITMGYDNVASEKTNITGYNIGLNVGKSAGQTVMYPHVHLIFRRDGDMEDPQGGVRGVIPSKQKY
jgi:diadenosine tetraphosphate (Ap4A) HIT family hydrolase|tara:strand:- start:5478 stop:5852 length:375 start_codon:yes stop_codon:yes gene_type:complete